MHPRTVQFFLVGVFLLAVALFFWMAAGGSSAPIAPVEKSAKTVFRSASVADIRTAAEIAAPVIDYAGILARFIGKDVERVPVAEKIFALTFDGGGNAEGVEKILQTLASNGLHATFFLTGDFMQKFPDIGARIVHNGGEVANHTVTHKDLSTLTDEEVIGEITGMQQIAEKQNIAVVPFFRFPYGAPTKKTITLANDLGYVAVRWTVDSLGWQGAKDGRDASFVQKRVVEKAIPGGIALMHLGSASDRSTFDADALPEIITTLSNEGYQFVSLSELFNEAVLIKQKPGIAGFLFIRIVITFLPRFCHQTLRLILPFPAFLQTLHRQQ